ncbi:MAG: apolipoprotein N-acyltransferase [Candidatus Omnitrophota bacterium]|nr:apolipoprotein N-acyltransferase [Candidatus Omnitrophota bacterium]
MKKQLIIELALALFCGILLAVSFSFSQCWILAWFAFVPLFLALDKQNAKKAFLLSYLSGLAFWTGTLYWLIHVTLLGQILLIFYLALYLGIFGFLLSFIFHHRPSSLLFFAPSLWVLLEYLRSHLLTGFPWALLGYSQYANLPVIQIADIAGVWLVSFLVMMVNVVIYVIARKRLQKRDCFASLAMTLIVLLIVLTYGYYKLYLKPKTKNPAPIKIAVIQGNIPQELKWDAGSREFVMERYFKLTSEAVKDGPDLIIWPEASLPVVLEDEPVYYERLLRYTQTMVRPLLFGAVTTRNSFYYNSALLLSKEGKLQERYDKVHLVPFGEFIPLRKVFPFLETIAPIGDIAPGKDYTLFNIQDEGTVVRHQFGVLICFEDVFPELSRRFVNKGADFLINITNDAWFGRTPEAYQHLAASVFRAVENRVNVVRSANTGVSAFINPQGRILSFVNDAAGNAIFIPGYQTQDISPHIQPTFYGRYGDFLVVGCCMLIILVLIIRKLRG